MTGLPFAIDTKLLFPSITRATNTVQFSCSSTDELTELKTPLGGLLGGSDKRVELRARARLADLAERRNRPKRTPLELGGTLEVLLDGVLRDCRTLHAFLQRRREVVQALGDSSRCDLCETEQHHVADDLDLI